MIYITGDTHIPVDIGKLSTKRFPQQKEMTKSDYVIICGDFGGVWDGSNEEKYWMKWLKSKNFTTLFVDGNHENFDILYNLPIVEFCGGMAHKVDDGIYHLIRGEAYNIDGKKFFVFGGASSHDKERRTEGKNWWKEELPTDEEYAEALNTLERIGWAVDYIITHCAPNRVVKKLNPDYSFDRLTTFLETVRQKAKFHYWLFAHYHDNKIIDERYVLLWEQIVQII